MRLAALALLLAAAAPEGDWTVNDITDNDTGERTVDALNLYITRTEYLTLRMRCVGRRPLIFVEWDDLPTARRMVFEVTVGAERTRSGQFTMERSDDVVNRGMMFDDPARFVALVDGEEYAAFTAHTSAGSTTIGMPIAGTARAWHRVEGACETDV